MNYKVIATPEFIKNLKNLQKKYKNIKNDVLLLANELELNPNIGTGLLLILHKKNISAIMHHFAKIKTSQ